MTVRRLTLRARVFLGALLLWCLPADAAVGLWVPTGSLSTPRLLHSAVLLHDGSVLVVGGVGLGGLTLAGAERYDPLFGLWSAAGTLFTPRNRHTATVLLDGRVLAAGGQLRPGEALSSVELFDPIANTWTPAAPMHTPRSNHTATLLSDGRVLVTGGLTLDDGGTVVVNSAEIFDPVSGSWQVTRSMREIRYSHNATLLPDGRVLVSGGFNVSPFHVPMKTAEMYQPATGQWQMVAPMRTARATHAVVVLPDGRVLVAGGWTQPPTVFIPTDASELFDPNTERWTSTGSLAVATGALDRATVVLGDGTVLTAGGQSATGIFAKTERYSMFAGAWRIDTPMSIARSGSHSATVLADGRVLVVGGRGPTGVLDTSELYVP